MYVFIDLAFSHTAKDASPHALLTKNATKAFQVHKKHEASMASARPDCPWLIMLLKCIWVRVVALSRLFIHTNFIYKLNYC